MTSQVFRALWGGPPFLVMCMLTDWLANQYFFWKFLNFNPKLFWVCFMKKSATVKNSPSWCRPINPWPWAEIKKNKFDYFSIFGHSFNVRINNLSNGWDRLTNHCLFGPRPGPNRPLPGKKIENNLSPNRCKAAESLDRLLSTESLAALQLCSQGDYMTFPTFYMLLF